MSITIVYADDVNSKETNIVARHPHDIYRRKIRRSIGPSYPMWRSTRVEFLTQKREGETHMLYSDAFTVLLATAPEFLEHHATCIGCTYGYDSIPVISS